MATLTTADINTEVAAVVSETTGILLSSTVLDTKIDTSGGTTKIFQVIGENASNITCWIKIWDLAIGSAPTLGGGVWTTAPSYVLPLEAGQTTDFTFLGTSGIVMSNGIIFAIDKVGGNYNAGATSISGGVSVTIYVQQ